MQIPRAFGAGAIGPRPCTGTAHPGAWPPPARRSASPQRRLTAARPPERPPPATAWLLQQRVAIPAEPDGYCHRPDLAARCALARRPVTALTAPGGFGKTTVLAAACRDAVGAGLPVAWLNLADDDAATLDAYLAFAFQRAGLDLAAALGAHGPPIGTALPRTAVLLRALEARDAPFVLALDELEQLADPDAVAVLDALLRQAPPHLHVALAYRSLPAGLASARALLDAEILTADDLRFSRPDIARFFGLALPRRRLAEIAAESGGWPIALRMRRNVSAEPPAADAAAVRDAVGSWIAARFWRAFAAPDREAVLDLALFDWVDRGLVDEVLERPGVFDRVAALPGLAGLLQPARTPDGTVYRLHPLLREHGAETMRRERPGRTRRLQRRIAAALARRGATVEAMRHAAEAGAARLAGAVLLEAGGLQWWLRAGADRLAAADRLLSERAIAGRPRLALFRSVALHYRGRYGDAQRLFGQAASSTTPDPAFEVDRLIASGILQINGALPISGPELQRTFASAVRIGALPTTSRVARGAFLYGMAGYFGFIAQFDAAADYARRTRELVVGRSAYLAMFADSLLGELAMARGRVREARRLYAKARRTAHAGFLKDPKLASYTELMSRELAFERNRGVDFDDHAAMAREVFGGGSNLTRYPVAAELAIAMETRGGGADAGLAMADDLAERAHALGIAHVAGFLAACRAGLLADAGRVAEAEHAWRAAGLPAADADCLSIDLRGWRHMEAVACARIRLLAAGGREREAANLEAALAATAARLGLRRTLVRALALRVRLRHAARDRDGAQAAATEYVRHYASTDYARPLLQAGHAATSALERLLDADPGGPLATPVRRLLAMTGATTAAAVRLDGREMAVLRLLGARRDKEIARALGLSRHGVRYHVGKIFRKLDVGRRQDAVRRAVALGILPDDGPTA